MRKLLFILLLLPVVGWGQNGQWSFHSYTAVNYTSNGATGTYKLFKTKDSLTNTGKPAVNIEMQGIGQRNGYGHDVGTMSWLADNGATMRFKKPSPATDSFSMWMVTPFLPSSEGSWRGEIVMDIIKDLKTTYASVIDTNKIFVTGYSLGGGGVFHYLSLNVNNGKEISAAAVDEGITSWTSISNFFNNVQADSTHLRIWYSQVTDNSTVLGNMQSLQSNSNNPALFGNWLPKIQWIVTKSGTHGDAPVNANDTNKTHTWAVDSSFLGPYSNSHTNVTYLNSIIKAEWLYSWTRLFVNPTLPPSCTTLLTPTNASTVSYAATAPLTWAYADSATSYDVYVYLNGGSIPGSPTANVTSLNYTATGLTGSMVYRWFVVPRNAIGAATGCATGYHTFMTAPPGTIDSLLNRPVVYDHAGYDDDGAEKFFDGWGVFNPFAGVNTDTTSINNPQHGWDLNYGSPTNVNNNFVKDSSFQNVYYRGTRGPDLWLDMTNYFDPTDTSVQATIRGIAFKVKGGSNQNFEIRRGDDVLAQVRANRMLYMSRMDSLVPIRATATMSGADGTIVTIDLHSTPIKTRWLVITIKNSGTAIANASEIAIQGQYNTKPLYASMLQEYTDTIPVFSDTSHTWPKVNGMNSFGRVDPAELTNWSNRVFVNVGKSYYNNDSTHFGPSPSYEFWSNIDGVMTISWLRAMTAGGRDMFFTLNGAKYLNQKTSTYVNGGYTYVNVDTPRVSNPELPSSYVNAGTFAFNIAAAYGAVNVSSGRTRWTNMGIYTNGLNIQIKTAFGNEDKYHAFTYKAMWAKKDAEWDGDEGRLGTDVGTKWADANFYNGMVASAEPDTNYYKVWRQLSWFCRSDHSMMVSGIEVHYYVSSNDSSGQVVSLATQVGSYGEAFERIHRKNGYNGITWWQKYLRTTRKYMGNIPVYHTEWGFGNDSVPSINQTQAGGPWDHFNIKPFGPWNNYQSKGIMILRYQIYEPFTGLAGNMNYVYTNSLLGSGFNPDTIGHGLFQSFGLVAGTTITFPFPSTTPWRYPAFWLTNSHNRRMIGYVPFWHPIISGNDSTGIWWAMWNKAGTDSFCVYTNYASYNGASSTGSVFLPGAGNGSVEEYDGSFSSLIGTSAMLSASNNSVTRLITEKPKAYFFKYSALPSGRYQQLKVYRKA